MSKLFHLLTATLFGVACMGSVVLAKNADSRMSTLLPEIHKVVDADAERMQEICKDIYEHAELEFMETRTAGTVARELRAGALAIGGRLRIV